MKHPDLANPAAECIHLKGATSAVMAVDVHLSETALKDLKNYLSVSAGSGGLETKFLRSR